VVDWKSDINPTDYHEDTGAGRGAPVFLTIGEVVWIEPAVRSGGPAALDA
jgi:hypothetical protein